MPERLPSLIELYRRVPGKHLTFDLTGQCNLSCQMCVWQNGRLRDQPKQHLHPEIFRRTLEEVAAQELFYSCINLSVSGEPSLHPQFDELIEFAFAQNRRPFFDVLSINTNMSAWTERRTDLVLDRLAESNGNLLITCSLNAGSRESYLAMAGRDLWNTVERNTAYLIRRAQAMHLGPRLRINVQMLVLPSNYRETLAFRERWSHEFRTAGFSPVVVGDRITADPAVVIFKREFDPPRQDECDRLYFGALEALGLLAPRPRLMSEELVVSAPQGPKKRIPCHALWLTPIIRSDGELSVCLSDVDRHMRIGNLGNASFLETWLGPTANELRRLHTQERTTELPICRSCSYYEAERVDTRYWDEFERMASKQANRGSGAEPGDRRIQPNSGEAAHL